MLVSVSFPIVTVHATQKDSNWSPATKGQSGVHWGKHYFFASLTNQICCFDVCYGVIGCAGERDAYFSLTKDSLSAALHVKHNQNAHVCSYRRGSQPAWASR